MWKTHKNKNMSSKDGKMRKETENEKVHCIVPRSDHLPEYGGL